MQEEECKSSKDFIEQDEINPYYIFDEVQPEENIIWNWIAMIIAVGLIALLLPILIILCLIIIWSLRDA